MTDRELLILAARAAYNEPMSWCDAEYFTEGLLSGWNPLENNGDAFCLMLALGLRLEYFSLDPFEVSGQPVCVITWAPGGERNRLCQTLTETGDEAHAVVRRAIVRAAAKIGGKAK